MGQTIAEKIIERHAAAGRISPGQIVEARPDRILLNDVSGPLAFQEFERMGATRVSDPEQVVLVQDHFAPAPSLGGATALQAVRRFRDSQGIEHFFDVGQGGIEHTLLPQQGLVRPGDLIIGGDSHTCTYGAFDAFGTGMGSTDIAAALALGEIWLRVPETQRFIFRGSRRPFVTGKDVILRVLREIGVDGANYQAMEFYGLGAFSMDERMAICNMVVEGGAKAGFVAPDEVTRSWASGLFKDAFTLVAADEDAQYLATRRFDLEAFGPQVARPGSPGDVSDLADVEGRRVDQVYIGNCANGTLTDLRQAAEVLRGRRVARRTRLIVVPATQEIYRAALEQGIIDDLVAAGAAVSTPSCGACFGGHMGLLAEGEVAITTTNRNFRGRMGHPDAGIYLASAYVAAASAVAGAVCDPAVVLGEGKR